MSAISNISKVFLICFSVNLILVKVHSYPKDFFMPDEFEDYTFEHDHHHHHNDYHDHHHDHDDLKPDVSSTLVLSHVVSLKF